jgi:pyruvate,water dikinase
MARRARDRSGGDDPSCAEGDTGFVYEGARRFAVERIDVSSIGRPATKIMMNVGNPDEAFAFSFIPNDGVGLARLEFIINNAIGVHPLALVRNGDLRDRARMDVNRLTAGYANEPAFFVDRLAQGVATIAAAFYPKDVIVRLSVSRPTSTRASPVAMNSSRARRTP